MSASGSSASRAVYFLGLEMPYEARLALRTMPTLDSLDSLLEAILAQILEQPEAADAAKRLQRSLSLDSSTLGALFTGVHWLVRVCMRSSLKAKALAAELADCKVHAPFVQPILQTVEQGCARHCRTVASPLPLITIASACCAGVRRSLRARH